MFDKDHSYLQLRVFDEKLSLLMVYVETLGVIV